MIISKSLIRGSHQLQSFRLLSTQVGVKPVEQSERVAAAVKHDMDWASAKSYDAIPGDSKLSLVRNFLPGGKFSNTSFIDFIKISRAQHGDIFRIPGLFGKGDIIFTFRPDDFERVYRTEGQWPIRRGVETLFHYRKERRRDFYAGVEGLVTSAGEEWGKFRSAVNPIMMQPNAIQDFLPKMFAVNSDFIERIKDIRDPVTNEVPETFEDEINRWTFESVAVVALDKQLGLIKTNRDNPDAKILFDNLNIFFRLMFELDVKPSMWKIVGTPNYYKLMRALDNVTDTTYKFVNEAIKRIEANKAPIDDRELSIFEKLLKVDKKIAAVMAMDMLFAGVDTTSSVFTGLLLAIAKNPEKQEKLRKETLKIMPNKDSPLTVESLRNLPYLRACVKEGMRFYPLLTGNFRTTGDDVVLSRYKVPKGIDIIFGTELLMRDEKYFPRPNEFIPERWLRDNDDSVSECPSAKTTNPFVFLPFGFGPRMCVGKRIVDLELEMGLARIVRHFNVEFNYSVENAFKCLSFNVPNIPLKFKFDDIKY